MWYGIARYRVMGVILPGGVQHVGPGRMRDRGAVEA